jgi:hypothetical protein
MSHHPPPNPDPLVEAALNCLRCLYIEDRFTAAKILRAWTRFDELSPTQVRQILGHYPSRSRPAVPPGVEGTSLGGRTDPEATP